jgi:ApaG protein
LLSSPFGNMSGYYKMVNFSNSNQFSVIIPAFKLSAPFALN